MIEDLTTDNDDYDLPPELISSSEAKEHLATSIANYTGEEVPSTGNTDATINYGYDTDEDYGTIQPFTKLEVNGEFVATIHSYSSKTLSLITLKTLH